MDAYRITITSWTASFRYPNLISGFQPSLAVPPVSTIFGLISSALGKYVSPYDMAMAYIFRFSSQAIDLETIYQIEHTSLSTKSNVIRRHILFDTTLWLYLADANIAAAFRAPFFPLLLGRSSDLATVESVETIELKEIGELTRLRGTTIPLGAIPLGAPVQALPIGFSNEIPRRNIGTKPFFLLEYDFRQREPLPVKGFIDSDYDHQIYIHDYRER